jgi:serine/threonine protein kinase
MDAAVTLLPAVALSFGESVEALATPAIVVDAGNAALTTASRAAPAAGALASPVVVASVTNAATTDHDGSCEAQARRALDLEPRRFIEATLLGEGGYGCVFRVRDTKAHGAPQVALKVLSFRVPSEAEARRAVALAAFGSPELLLPGQEYTPTFLRCELAAHTGLKGAVGAMPLLGCEVRSEGCDVHVLMVLPLLRPLEAVLRVERGPTRPTSTAAAIAAAAPSRSVSPTPTPPAAVSAITARQRLEIAQGLCRAVAAAHAGGWAHRDITPSNVFLPLSPPSLATPTARAGSVDPTKGAAAVLGDYGLATRLAARFDGRQPGPAAAGAIARQPAADPAAAHARRIQQGLTADCVTLWYRPPELLRIARDGAASTVGGSSNAYGAYDATAVDAWCLGLVLCELALGHPLFPGTDAADQLARIEAALGDDGAHAGTFWTNQWARLHSVHCHAHGNHCASQATTVAATGWAGGSGGPSVARAASPSPAAVSSPLPSAAASASDLVCLQQHSLSSSLAECETVDRDFAARRQVLEVAMQLVVVDPSSRLTAAAAANCFQVSRN